MKTHPKTVSRFRRHKRIRARMSGTKDTPRLVVFRSITNTYAILVNDEANRVICAASSMKMKKGTKAEKAKEVGTAIAKIAQEKGVKSCVFDRNGYQYHGRIKAVADGAREGGLQF